MTWRFVNAAARGTSHDANDSPCQDDCFADVETPPGGESVLIALVADGAGSAPRSEVGSGIACASLRERIGETLRGCALEDITSDVVEAWLTRVREEIEARAQLEERDARQFACTVLGAVVGERRALFFQIGDGAIVVSGPQGFDTVFWPEPGEYANVTHFLTEPDFAAHLQIAMIEDRIDEVALFSDGLQRLALRFGERAVHGPFFEPMLRQLRAQPPGLAELFVLPLLRFLSSDAVNSRTDDDKSLVLATRRA